LRDKKCICAACSDDRIENKCKNPHSCAVAVKNRLEQLLPKWDPRIPDADDRGNDSGEEDRVKVVRDTKPIENLTDGFRVFTNAPEAGGTEF
ncbi:hypothetical protein C8R46DRAFT_875541, partial [Mycena filopes]